MAESNVDDYFFDDEAEDLSYSDLDNFPDFLLERAKEIRSLLLNHNQITVLPRCIGSFVNLISLDISNNNMRYISGEIANLTQLRTLTCRNNNLNTDCLPKELAEMTFLQSVNFSGNNFIDFPMQLTDITELRSLHLGGNQIKSLPREIVNLKRLEILYLGGNQLTELPIETGFLGRLQCLVLCDNRLESLPSSLARLRSLQSLSLHNNKLSTLPPEIIKLNLIELSLRNNPLVHRFVEDLTYEPPTLLELAGRVAKVNRIPYSGEDLPQNLVQYLDSAHSCVNPKCKGVYFSSRVEHVKFVDFCGKYRLPLLEYLCSPTCRDTPYIARSSSESESEDEFPISVKLKKVLLG